MSNKTAKTDQQDIIASGEALHTFERLFGEHIATARAGAVFGAPVQHGSTMVIPCADVFIAGGIGTGGGSGSDEDNSNGSGSGAGAGGTARGRPVAIIVVEPEKVRVEPVVDVTRIALAALTTVGFAVVWLARLARATRRDKGGGPSLKDLREAV
ncbi:MAG: hypothetical protein HC914_21555 [Chloroflexaceae bacterium]|nr:hypothetical protein [Chloroflexaceae bacterium]